MLVSFNMATMPHRIDVAIKAIESIYDQADIIRVYLNNFKEVPKELKKEKIVTYIGEDLKSSGKLFWSLNKNEYYFCIDDDLIYPSSYKDDMISALNNYNDEIVVTLHGKIMKKGLKKNYFRDHLGGFHCLRDVKSDSWVHVIGNGVSAFNTNKVKIDYKKFKYHYMDDISVSLQLQEQKIGALVLKHKKGYLKSNPPKGKTLYDIYHNNDKTQTEMVNSIEWEFFIKDKVNVNN